MSHSFIPFGSSTSSPSIVVLENTIGDPSVAEISPGVGTYIVPSSGTSGVFVGREGNYATWDGETWTFTGASDGDRAAIAFGTNAGNVFSYASSTNTWTFQGAPVSTFPSEFYLAGTTIGADDPIDMAYRRGYTGFSNAVNFFPKSVLDAGETLGLSYLVVPSGNIAPLQNGANVVYYLTSATAQSVSIAVPAAIDRRIYTFVNTASIAKSITSYIAINGVASTVIPPYSSLTVQATGGVLRQMDSAGISFVAPTGQTILSVAANQTVALGGGIEIRVTTAANGFDIRVASGTKAVRVTGHTNYGAGAWFSTPNGGLVNLTTTWNTSPWGWSGSNAYDTGVLYIKDMSTPTETTYRVEFSFSSTMTANNKLMITVLP